MDNGNNTAVNTKVETNALEKITEASIQDTSRDNQIFNNFLRMAVKSGELLPSWWSPSRDVALDRMALQCDQFLGATHKVQNRITAASWEVTPRNPTIKSHRHLADVYNSILFDSLENGQGWYVWLQKWLWSLFVKDNGAFAEIITDDGLAWDTPRQGRVIGSNVLDSSKCTRTSNPLFPVVYRDNSIRTAIHYTRIMFTSQQPSSISGMNGVGKCWLTRAINNVQTMVDMSVHKQEKLGSRPNPQIVVASGGLSATDIAKASLLANQSNDNQGFTRYAKKIIVGSANNPNGKVDIVDLVDSKLFNEKESTEIGMASIALSGGYPFRDFWPSQGAVAKADAEFSHITGTSGYKQLIDTLIFLFSGNPASPFNITPKFLPKELQLTATLVDDDQQQRQAEVKQKRTQTWALQLDKNIFDVRTIREQAYKTGDITQQQFEREELENDRLPNGESTILLFLSDKAIIQKFLDLPFNDVTNIESNKNQASEIIKAIDAQITIINTVIINGNSPQILLAARQSRSALNLLKKEYEAVSLNDVLEDDTNETIENTFNPADNFRQENPKNKQTEGVNLPNEVTEYEKIIEDLITKGTEGEITQDEFEKELEEAVIEFTTLVFLEGIGESGEDLEDEEREFLASQIDVSLDSIPVLAEAVFSNKFLPIEDGGAGNSPESRSNLWGGFLASVFYAGMLLTREDNILYQWVWTPGKDHCTDCISRNGVIKTAKEWRVDFENGIYPKSVNLECKGFRCGCGLFIVSGGN